MDSRFLRRRFAGTGAWFGLLSLSVIAGARLCEAMQVSLRPCPFLSWTGHPCPTCFGSRALAALGRFDPAGALYLQPLVAVAALSLITWGALDILFPGQGTTPSVRRLPRRGRKGAAWSLLLLIAGNWAYLLLRGSG